MQSMVLSLPALQIFDMPQNVFYDESVDHWQFQLSAWLINSGLFTYSHWLWNCLVFTTRAPEDADIQYGE